MKSCMGALLISSGTIETETTLMTKCVAGPDTAEIICLKTKNESGLFCKEEICQIKDLRQKSTIMSALKKMKTKKWRIKKNYRDVFDLVFTFPTVSMWHLCEEPRLCLSHLNDGTDRWRVPLQDEDHPGNDPHLVPGFPPLCSGMFPKGLRSASVSVGSREIRLI